MGKKIMLQGTASNVGKSIITTGLCRIFKQDGYNVIPFKSQNMALNSFITKEGLEMGRAQVSQAEACGIDPIADMNPILLKPNGNNKSQVIVRGKVVGDMSSKEYHEYKLQLTEVLGDIFEEFEEKYDVVVMEGAGSCAEIKLMERDISNMGMAEIADAPVIIIGDIDRGGVFASLAGTMLLLPDKYKKRVKGVIINKFRGRKELLDSGIKMLEDIIKVPVLGVLPYTDIKIEEEDSMTTRFKQKINKGDIFVAFSTANENAFCYTKTEITMLSDENIDPFFKAAAQAVEEAILNALCAAETMQGRNLNTVYAMPHDQVKEILKKYANIVEAYK